MIIKSVLFFGIWSSPELNKLSHVTKEDTCIHLHKGKRVYRTLLKDIVATTKENGEILLIGVDEENLIKNVEPIYLKQYFTIISENHIKERVIIKKSVKKHNFKNVAYKFLDDAYLGNVEQIIYGDKVALFIFGAVYHMILLENKQVAQTYRKQFELLWKLAKN